MRMSSIVRVIATILAGHKTFIALYPIETPLNTFANRAYPDQAALVRAA